MARLADFPAAEAPTLFFDSPAADKRSVGFLLNPPLLAGQSVRNGPRPYPAPASLGTPIPTEPLELPKARHRRAPRRSSRVECATCGRDFAGAGALRKHRRAVHLGERRWGCTACGRRFAERANLRKHCAAVHERRRAHGCADCEKRFAFSDGLRRHINNCHLGLRPYTCPACGAAFKQRTHLQKHDAAVHASPKPPPESGRYWSEASS